MGESDAASSRSLTKAKVVVVGGGLIGSLQALFLAKNNFQVELYERRKDIRTVDKAEGRSINLALSIRGREALREVGLEEAVLKNGLPMSSRMIHHAQSGKLSKRYYGKSGQSIYSVDRLNLNKLLLDAVEASPNVNLHFEHQLIRADLNNKELHFSSSQPAAAVMATSGQPSLPSDVRVDCDFIFGCDGAHSTVRRQMMRWGQLNYQQEYIEHGYKELTIPPTRDGNFAMDEGSLHIWPRGEFMMIALPNLDRTFTLTLFMPFTKFKSIETEEDLLAFFMKYFQDSVPLIGADKLVEEYFTNPVGGTISVKCTPHYMAGSTVILGDAAHAVVPFYGQGMNAGFEDCLVFQESLRLCGDDLASAASHYSESHWKDAHTIADLSLYNYIEMRSLVLSRTFLLRRYVDNILHFLFPGSFIPLYSMMAFSRIPYSQVVVRHRRQQKWVTGGLCFLAIGVTGGLLWMAVWYSGIMLPLKYRILPCVTRCFVKDVVTNVL